MDAARRVHLGIKNNYISKRKYAARSNINDQQSFLPIIKPLREPAFFK